ncbi:RNA polymerase subunit sigma-70 [Geodermatophilus sp. SYSU D00710]
MAVEPVDVPGPEDPEAALAAVVALRRLASRLEVEAVVEAVGQGWTWAQVGEALGISAQAAHKRFAAEVRARRGHRPGGEG